MTAPVPKRVRLYTDPGWRLPGNTVSITLPNRWSNPYVVSVPFQEPAPLSPRTRKLIALRAFTGALRDRTVPTDCRPSEHLPISLTDVRHHLRGKDLACWCKLCDAHALGRPMGSECELCDPCHGDFLLLIANTPDGAS